MDQPVSAQDATIAYIETTSASNVRSTCRLPACHSPQLFFEFVPRYRYHRAASSEKCHRNHRNLSKACSAVRSWIVASHVSARCSEMLCRSHRIASAKAFHSFQVCLPHLYEKCAQIDLSNCGARVRGGVTGNADASTQASVKCWAESLRVQLQMLPQSERDCGFPELIGQSIN